MSRLAASALLLLAALAAAIGAVALAVRAPALPAGVLADGAGRSFLVLVNVLFLGLSAHVVNASAVVRDDEDRLAERFALLGLPFLAACDGAILADDPVLTWLGLEVSTLFAAPLVASGRSDRMAASFQYFLFSAVALALVMAGFTCLSLGAGDGPFTWSALGSDPPADGPWVEVGLFLAMAGYGAKLGFFPLNTWLPTTYATAPGPFAALLGTVQFNTALLGLVRVVETWHGVCPSLVGPFLAWSGLATMAVSTLGIVTTGDYLRLLAYASINHAGVLAVGLGTGAPAAYGVLVYAASNAFVKGILFLAAGRVRASFRTTEAARVRGLVKLLPYNGVLLMVGTFALLGLPPFGSFLGELLILSALVEAGRTELLFPFCVLLVVSFVATGRTLFPMIWGEPAPGTEVAHERLGVAVPKLVFLAALVVLGLYVPAPVNDLLRDVAAHLGAP